MSIKFYKVDVNAVVPERHSTGAAGYDLRSIQNVVVNPNEFVTIKTGLFIDLKNDILGIILSRSGLSFKNGLEVKNSYVVDRKEMEVTLFNNSLQPFQVEKGMRIAQLVFMKKNEKGYEIK